MKYIFARDFLTFNNAKEADAEVIGTALEEIAEKHDGQLRPKEVVEESRDPAHPLHRHFEWDDHKAAERHRIDQARNIIRSVRLVAVDDRPEAPAYFSVNAAGGASYRGATEVLKSADLQSRVLAQAERDLLAFERRYANLVEICDLIRNAREQISKRNAPQAEATAAA